MKRTTKLTISYISASVLAIGCLCTVYAANHEWKSTGAITVQENDKSSAFDTRDIENIYNDVHDGRESIATVLNTKGYGFYNHTSYNHESTHSELTTGVSSMFNMPPSPPEQYYVQGDGRVIGTTETDTPYTDEFSSAEPNNLAAGVMGWDNNGNILFGTGVDIEDSKEEGYEDGIKDGAVTINLHKHTVDGGCYKVTYKYRTRYWCSGSPVAHNTSGGDWDYTCSKCGGWFSDGDWGPGHWKYSDYRTTTNRASIPSNAVDITTSKKLICNKSTKDPESITVDGINYYPSN